MFLFLFFPQNHQHFLKTFFFAKSQCFCIHEHFMIHFFEFTYILWFLKYLFSLLYFDILNCFKDEKDKNRKRKNEMKWKRKEKRVWPAPPALHMGHPDPTYIRLHPHPWPNPSHSTPSSVRTICLYGEGRRGGRRCARCFFRDREGTARVINVLSSPPLSVTPSSAAPSRALPRHPLPPLPRPLLSPPPFRHRHRHRPPSSLN